MAAWPSCILTSRVRGLGLNSKAQTIKILDVEVHGLPKKLLFPIIFVFHVRLPLLPLRCEDITSYNLLPSKEKSHPQAHPVCLNKRRISSHVPSCYYVNRHVGFDYCDLESESWND